MQLSKKICGSVFGFAAFLMVSSVVRADAVTDWNAITVQTIVNAGPSHSSAVSFLDSATVQVAVYDAVVAIDGRFKPYHVQIPGASGSPVAAVAAAAHDVLVNRFPSQAGALDMVYSDYLNTHNLMGNPGIAVGQQAAAGRELPSESASFHRRVGAGRALPPYLSSQRWLHGWQTSRPLP